MGWKQYHHAQGRKRRRSTLIGKKSSNGGPVAENFRTEKIKRFPIRRGSGRGKAIIRLQGKGKVDEAGEE